MDVKTVTFKPFTDQKAGTYVAPTPAHCFRLPIPDPRHPGGLEMSIVLTPL